MVENRIYSSWLFILLSYPSALFTVNLQSHLNNSKTEAREKKRIKEEHGGKKGKEMLGIIRFFLILFLCPAVR